MYVNKGYKGAWKIMKTAILITLIVIIVLGIALDYVFVCSRKKTDYDIKLEDEEQLESIKAYNKTRNKRGTAHVHS